MVDNRFQNDYKRERISIENLEVQRNHTKYNEQRKKVKVMIKENKEKTWIDFGEKLAKQYSENHELFYVQ